MSTKIYTGYHLGNPTFFELNNLLNDYRKKVEEIMLGLYVEDFAKKTVEIVDGLSFGNLAHRPAENSIMSSVYWDMVDQIRKGEASDSRLEGLDLTARVWVFPIDGAILAYVGTEHGEYLEAFGAMPGVKEYGYWDNSDKPDEVTEEEWGQREKDWGKALFKHTLSECGPSYHFSSKGNVGRSKGLEEQVIAALPSHRNRATAIADNILHNERHGKAYEVLHAQEDFSISDLTRLYREFRNWLETEEGKAAREKKILEVLPQVKVIDHELLHADLAEMYPDLERRERKR